MLGRISLVSTVYVENEMRYQMNGPTLIVPDLSKCV